MYIECNDDSGEYLIVPLNHYAKYYNELQMRQHIPFTLCIELKTYYDECPINPAS